MSLQLELEQRGRVLIVRLNGELDHHSAEQVKIRMEEMIAKGSLHIILSLKGLAFMDSSGLGVILGRYRQIKAKGGQMVICDISPTIYRLFEMSGLFKIMSIQVNERMALSSLEAVR